jgi:hypothetical protein
MMQLVSSDILDILKIIGIQVYHFVVRCWLNHATPSKGQLTLMGQFIIPCIR